MTPKRALPTIAALLTWLVPVLCYASDGETGHHSAGHDAGGHGGHGGPLHFTDIISGPDSLEFWGAVVNFLLLVALLVKLGRAPLSAFLTNRSKAVEDGMQEAAALKAEAQRVFDEYSERLKTMDDDIAKLKQEIRDAAEADKQRIIDDAQRTADRMRADAENLINQQARELSAQIRAEVVDAAMETAEKVIRKVLSSDEQQALATRYQAELAEESESASYTAPYPGNGAAAELGGQS